VVTVRDDVDSRIAGHAGARYVSPPGPTCRALADPRPSACARQQQTAARRRVRRNDVNLSRSPS